MYLPHLRDCRVALLLIAMDGMYAGFAGAKACRNDWAE
jgi:hypothetical protein